MSKMILLHIIGNPEQNNGEPTECFVRSDFVLLARRSVAAFNSIHNPAERFPLQECTELQCCHGTSHVIETPAEIAKLIEDAEK